MLSRHTKRAFIGLTFAGITIVLIGAATRNYFAQRALDLRLEQERAEMTQPQPLTFTVERSTRARERVFPIELEPFQRTSVASEVSGRIVETKIETADFVEEGDLLFQLDSTLAELMTESARAALNAAEIRLQETERRVREAENLAEASTIPRTELEAVRAEKQIQIAEVARLKSELKHQEELLKRHQIRAPFSGHINRRLVETGDSVNVFQPVANLVSLDPLRLRLHVSDLEVGSFQPGEILSLEIDAFPGQQFEAPVLSVASAEDPENGLFLVEGSFANPDGIVRGGANGKVRATIAIYENQLFVPAAAVRFEGRRSLVEKVTGAEAGLHEIKLGPEIDGFYPVLNGLSEGDELLVR